MINFNNIAIQCDTEEKAKILLAALKKCGYNWDYGENVTCWETYEDETCYFIKNNEIMYHARASLKNLVFYHGMYNVVSFDDIDFPIHENKKAISEITRVIKDTNIHKISDIQRAYQCSYSEATKARQLLLFLSINSEELEEIFENGTQEDLLKFCLKYAKEYKK